MHTASVSSNNVYDQGNSLSAPNALVTLFVGEKPKKLLTNTDTLNKLPEGKLHLITQAPSNADGIFIDRNPRAFKEVLRHLRDGSLPSAPKAGWEAVMREAEHFGLAQLEQHALDRITQLPVPKDNSAEVWDWICMQVRVGQALLAKNEWGQALGFFWNARNALHNFNLDKEGTLTGEVGPGTRKEIFGQTICGLLRAYMGGNTYIGAVAALQLADTDVTCSWISTEIRSLAAECCDKAGRPDVAARFRAALAPVVPPEQNLAELNEDLSELNVLVGTGESYLTQNKWDQALQYFWQAQKILARVNDNQENEERVKPLYNRLWCGLLRAYMQPGLYDKAAKELVLATFNAQDPWLSAETKSLAAECCDKAGLPQVAACLRATPEQLAEHLRRMAMP